MNIKLQGGLGDVLLHTPLFKKFFEKNKKKINCFVENETEFNLLLNNPYINLFLIDHDSIRNEMKIFNSSLTEEEHVSFLEKNDSINFYTKHYFNLKPSFFWKKKSHIIIGEIYNFKNIDSLPQIFLKDEEIKSGKEKISNYKNIKICICPSSNIRIKEWKYYKWEKIIKLYPNIHFFQLGNCDDYKLKGALDFTNLKLRDQISILNSSDFYIGVDSFWQHAAKALNKKSIILFGPSNSEIWGYDDNVNIIGKADCSPCIDWKIMECPYGKICMNDIQISNIKKSIDVFLENSISH